MARRVPVPLTTFVGRARELEALTSVLSEHRQVTILGTGGVGKTRLAAELARSLGASFPDGVWWADLAVVSDPALVLAPVLAAVDRGDVATLAGLKRRLRRRRGLLILDNCEGVAAACAPLVEELLGDCPQLRVLATSREPLGSSGEVRWSLAPLEVEPAVQLFAERAQAVLPGVVMDPARRPTLAQICLRLDGLPLAIELAAARVDALSVNEISRRLDQRLDLLSGGPRTARSQHQSLRAALDWSFDLLSERERRLLGRLSVFSGGWTLAAAEAVCADEGESVFEDLRQLIAKSLVVAGELGDGRRFRMLETVREYAREKLAASNRLEQVRDRHLAWASGLVERLGPSIRGPEQPQVFAELEVEHGNLVEAFEWAIATVQVEPALAMAGQLWWFWFPCGHARQGCSLLARLLALPETAQRPALRAGALEGLAVLERDLGDLTTANAAAEEALDLRRRLGDRLALAESLVIAGWARIFLGEFERAYALWSENLEVSEGIGAEWNAAEAMIDLGWLDSVRGDLDGARARLEQGVATMRRLGSDVYLAYGLFFSAYAALFEGRRGDARRHLAESLSIYRRLGGRRLMEPALAVLSGVAARDGAAEVAVFLAGAGDALQKDLGLAPFPGFHDRVRVEVDAARRALGRRAAAVFERGRECDFEEALDEALRFALADGRQEPAAGLTMRQRTVAGLVAQGLSNREIATSLAVAPGTVKRHVEDILTKLGLESRAQIAAWAVTNLSLFH